MNHPVTEALWLFSQQYIAAWQSRHGSLPESDLYEGLASPCVVKETDRGVQWQPVKRNDHADLSKIEAGMEIRLCEEAHAYFSSQFSGDMSARLDDLRFELVQVWNDDDFVRLQENLIGHLVTQRRRKLNPTLFIGTTDAELEVISLSNLTGEVILETLGTDKHTVLAPSLAEFLSLIKPDLDEQASFTA
ncbi:SecY-interacting protein [Parasalinivibrio latis]|uniref:SecY-interacting protein n=1 Tax=Parasalinivibrio latis TaxID=2952610 RepID=UPI0030E1B1B6